MTAATDDEAELRKLLDRAAAAETAGDVEAFMSLLTDDAMMLPPSQPVVVGTEAIRSWWQAALAQVSLEVQRAVAEEVQIGNDLACLRVSYSHVATNKADGSSHPETGKSLWVGKRQQDGSWKFSRVIWNG